MVEYTQLSLDLETWKPIPDYEGLYEISDQGRIRRLPNTPGCKDGRIRKPNVTQTGYHLISLSREGNFAVFLIHVLVMKTFVGPCPLGLEINHIDGNKANNCLTNLEYVTRSANHKHAFRLGLRKIQKNGQPGMRNGRAKLTDDDVRKIREFHKTGIKPATLGKQFGVSESTIRRIVCGVGWNHVKD